MATKSAGEGLFLRRERVGGDEDDTHASEEQSAALVDDAPQHECVCCLSRDVHRAPHPCLKCDEICTGREDALAHLLQEHRIVLGEVDHILDLPRYVCMLWCV